MPGPGPPVSCAVAPSEPSCSQPGLLPFTARAVISPGASWLRRVPP